MAVAALRDFQVPVLCYHRIGGPLELGVTRVSRPVFTRHMTALARAGWRSLTLDEFARTTHHAPRTFLLTFDDGYASLVEHAFPLLAELGFTATTFLITGYIGKTNTWDARYTWKRVPHLGWAQLERWQARGFAFGSHGATHQRLTWLSEAAALAELKTSRELLLNRLGPAAGLAVAYPFGAVNDDIIRLASSSGYELGFGGVRGGGRLNVSRLPVYAWDLGSVPLGLRAGGLGRVGRSAAHIANRCSVGTSLMMALRRSIGRRAAAAADA